MLLLIRIIRGKASLEGSFWNFLRPQVMPGTWIERCAPPFPSWYFTDKIMVINIIIIIIIVIIVIIVIIIIIIIINYCYCCLINF